ncbi:MAG: hypothetical protein ATN35_09930 [Epulopiscium sp. Nele67-Bin004]|nr:MAG: hypothetical protein ATN35_09930 [Epulopiscium sp. Nele67-Bin004]
MMDELLLRINELANKKKAEGLTDDELEEQQELRKQYLKIFRGNFKQQLENTKIQTPDGQLHPLKYAPPENAE